MAIEVFDKDATTKTHGVKAGTAFDLVNPFSELVGSTNNGLRSAIHVGAAWLIRGKMETGSFSLTPQR